MSFVSKMLRSLLLNVILQLNSKTAHFRTVYVRCLLVLCEELPHSWSLSKPFVYILYTVTISRRSSRVENQWSEVILVFNIGRCLGCIIPRCANPGRQVARANKFCTATPVFVVLSMYLASCHPSGGRNFEVASTFLIKLCAHVLRNKYKVMCWKDI